ncbi:MAG TPA: M56 family metallopeptidase [Steroidobacteraceae bacterium]
MMLLLESALRSLFLGFLVWALLKLVRIRDSGTETFIWTAVLIVALSMPLLSHYMPRLVVAIPQLSATASPSATAAHWARANQPSLMRAWLNRYGEPCLLGVYALGALICLTRLITGLILTLVLCRRALPVEADWAQGRNIRASAALKGPASLGRVILLPADYPCWSPVKREAVLAHEEAHIARGDFFVQLAAAIHRALFWFSPFAWWLQSKLSEIAETASDEAAIRRLDDRVSYAEILVEVARGAQPPRLIIAMAKGPLIQERIDRILSAAPGQQPSLPVRVLIVAALSLTVLGVASADAAFASSPVNPISHRPIPVRTGPTQASAAGSTARNSGATRTRGRLTRAAHLVRRNPVAPSQRDAAVSYNPRALLDPVYTRAVPYVPASTIVHAGKTFYIGATERPVAETWNRVELTQ